MSVMVLHDREKGIACFYCTTTDWAFGPVVIGDDEHGRDPAEQLEGLQKWLVQDPRAYAEGELAMRFVEWRQLPPEGDDYDE